MEGSDSERVMEAPSGVVEGLTHIFTASMRVCGKAFVLMHVRSGGDLPLAIWCDLSLGRMKFAM